jgi:hypothetical protein
MRASLILDGTKLPDARRNRPTTSGTAESPHARHRTEQFGITGAPPNRTVQFFDVPELLNRHLFMPFFVGRVDLEDSEAAAAALSRQEPYSLASSAKH